jgi:hypothetical protein
MNFLKVYNKKIKKKIGDEDENTKIFACFHTNKFFG